MGQIVIPKHTADLEEIFAALKIYYEAGDWLENTEHTSALKLLIGANQYPSSYPKKAQMLSYYGFTEWNVSKSSQRRITKLGKSFYEHYVSNDQNALFEDIMRALETTTFGRNNKGVESSDSDVEPPNLLMRAILDLGYITNREYSYFLWKIAVNGGSYSDIKEEIKERREQSITDIPEEANQPAYTDLKIILFLVRLGFLISDTTSEGKKCTRLNKAVKEKYEKRIRNLKIFNIDRSTDEICYDSQEKELALVIDNKDFKENYTIEELGKILTRMYGTAENKTTAIHMFGLKYGEVITRNGYSAAKLVSASDIPDSYHVEVSKGIAIYKSIKDDEFGVRFADSINATSIIEKVAKEFPSLSKRSRKIFELNSILYGAPGTGKTYATAKYALAIVENKSLEEISSESREEIMKRYNNLIKEDRVVFTTFHQNYGYEDFVQGIRPDTTTAEMHFKTVDGVFKKIAEKAMDNSEKDFVIIIDEINRANISKVFGELITLIEEDKRWGEENAVSVTLPSGEAFAVPNNLYIVGTMNSADKSISLIDTALRRRFEFIEFVPNLGLIEDRNLKMVLEKLNKGISAELNSTDLLVGHSYFINKKADNICAIMNRSIIPLLYEYFFDNKNKVEAQLKTALEGLDVEVVSNTMGRLTIKKKEV